MRKKKHSKKNIKDGKIEIDRQAIKQANVFVLELIRERKLEKGLSKWIIFSGLLFTRMSFLKSGTFCLIHCYVLRI